MDAALRDGAAKWLAEALQTGGALAPLPAQATPRSMLDGQRVAARVLEMLDMAPCGMRLACPVNEKVVPGPVLESRVLKDGVTIPMATLHHPHACAAVIGVLAEELPRRGDAMPVFAALRPAIDIGCWRLPEPPTTSALAAADLAGLGYIVAGKAKRMPPMRLRISLAPTGTWRRGEEVELEDAMQAAALAARRAGGLPEGALLVTALGQPITPQAGLELHASFGRLGRVQVRFE
ncbi:hypothetical protein [Paracraurococcus lichenis]|uniref:Hydratase n=1 Tax=Paracraurococcus lichenis TaxID=3064888 RepID=A0ABT9DWU2_9PROT|nr:hypothetical protein [Paracraurococcus sp. LOR1-02]MDO9708371.1 hypothetical protein [Paracraurococcus sp. LOR1-02]